MTLVNLKQNKQATEVQGVEAPQMDAPEYPYGLRIELDNETLDKLGLTLLPEAGAVVMLQAKASVVSVSTNEYEGEGKRSNVSLQITDMALAVDDGKTAAQRLYNKSDLNA